MGKAMAKPQFLTGSYRERSDAETREYYDQWSQVYDEELGANDYRQPRRCADTLLALMPETDARILDVGCGTGLSGLALAESGYRFVDGCDFSMGMLEKAFERGVYSKAFVADLNQPPLDAPDGYYGAVTAVGVFSFGHFRPDAVSELLRLTKSGGPVVIGINDKFYLEGSLMAKLEHMQRDGQLAILSVEHGEHIPGIDLTGWVIALRKPS
jgi:predicted TPR repeat methyltransferase